jgi:hypothetical protein
MHDPKKYESRSGLELLSKKASATRGKQMKRMKGKRRRKKSKLSPCCVILDPPLGRDAEA